MTRLPKGFSAPVELGSGGEARTVLCWQDDPGRWVVLKIGEVSGASRLRKEAQLLEKLAGGPVPALLGKDLTGRHPWIAMTWIEGMPLDSLPDEFCISDRKAIVLQATLAMARLHGGLVVHGDLSASNLIVRPHGEVAVLDFGLSPVPGIQGGVEIGGAWEILPPERLQGGAPDPRWDVFALGILGARVMGVFPDWNAKRDEWTSFVASGEASKSARGRSYALSLALDPDPSERPVDAAALLRLLEREWGDPAFGRDVCAKHASLRLEDLLGKAVRVAESQGDWESAWRLQRERIERAKDPVPLMAALGEYQRKRMDPPARRRLRIALAISVVLGSAAVAWWNIGKSGDVPSELEQGALGAMVEEDYSAPSEDTIWRKALVFDPPPDGAILTIDGRSTQIPPDGFLPLPEGRWRIVLRDSLGLEIFDTTVSVPRRETGRDIGSASSGTRKAKAKP